MSDSPDGTSPFAIRALTAADAEAYRLMRLGALREQPFAFGSLPEDEENVSETARKIVETDDRCFFGAFQGGQLVGIVRLSRYEARNEKHRAYLAGLYVLPQFRRGGAGRALVRQALKKATTAPGVRRVNLSVVTQQEAAIRLYQSFGFHICGTEKETFSNGGKFYDEYLMTLKLSDDPPDDSKRGVTTSVTELPFNHFLGLQAAPDSTKLLLLPSGGQYLNHLGTVHASALLALAEATSGEFLLRHFGSSAGVVPVVRRIEAKFRKPANGGVSSTAGAAPEALTQLDADLAAKGRALISVAVELHDESGSHTLSASVEWFIQRVNVDKRNT